MAGDRDDGAGQAAHLGGRGLQVFHLAAGDDDGGAGLGQPRGDRPADPPPPAGDERDLAGEVEGDGHLEYCSRIRRNTSSAGTSLALPD